MNIAKKGVITALASGALLLNSFVPVFADTTVVINGNGSGSENYTTVNQTTTTSVTQTNTADVTNKVDSSASTGGNTASFNTGGSTTIGTGDATSKTVVANDLNSNTAQVSCCAAAGDTTVKVSGNGAFTDNTVKADLSSTTSLGQSNSADVYNHVDANASTGENKASLNTGGNTTIGTGDATTDVKVVTAANSNVAMVGGPTAPVTPSASFEITGNGSGSDNFVLADLSRVSAVTQTNEADVTNKVDASAKTGYNTADFNTGGDVLIGTGMATAKAAVDNMVNFNYAAMDCGCAWDVTAKIAGNGAGSIGDNGFDWLFAPASHNTLELGLTSVQALGQGNSADLYNKLDDVKAKTGGNTDTLNTGPVQGDPSYVFTGDAFTQSGVSNSGNVNVDGGTLPLDWPFGNTTVSFNWNWSGLLAWFGMSS